MEFPSIGAHCASTSCQSLSFLPFQCPFCSLTYCSTHRLPAAHACQVWEAESAANSVHLCPRCDRLLLAPRGSDQGTILQEHLDHACGLHLLPAVHSIAVLCALPTCGRRDRVVQKCDRPPGGCALLYCLKHRHPSDHACTKLKEREQGIKDSEIQMSKKKEAIASKFTRGSTSRPSSTVLTGRGALSPEEKTALSVAKADQARAAIAEAKAKVAARTVTAEGSGSSGISSGARSTTTSVGPKVKKASRVVSLIKLRKVAQGEDNIPASARLHVYIRSPAFPMLDDKAVYVDKTWTVGRAMDKIIERLKITVPKNEPFDAQKRFSIFHAKEPEDPPELLSMPDRLQALSKIESGDIFYLAPADHLWP